MELEEIRKSLEKTLKHDRYTHTIGVMYTAAALAMRYQTDMKAALIAGLLHDCAKFAPVNVQMALCEKYHVELTESDREVPALVHAKLGVFLAEAEYGIKDKCILDAIRYHTTGRPNMNMLEKIVYLADYIEPGRKMIPGLTEVRTLAFTDIDQAVCKCSELTLSYLERVGRTVDPMTRQTYEYYK